ncbi:hypothetical protein AGMMS49975_26430 [Clostridia bacterium]|nr:hypothetical protein AGMMS49975_26430 [Clostridia bacterium]GHU77450.1 hypothetical protein FACS1894188_11740 [Clostridia bacterium]
MRDRKLLQSILRYVLALRKINEDTKDLSNDEFSESLEALALSQCIINLYSMYYKFHNPKVQKELAFLNNNEITKFKNIAIYDYDALNWANTRGISEAIATRITDDYIQELLMFK